MFVASAAGSDAFARDLLAGRARSHPTVAWWLLGGLRGVGVPPLASYLGLHLLSLFALGWVVASLARLLTPGKQGVWLASVLAVAPASAPAGLTAPAKRSKRSKVRMVNFKIEGYDHDDVEHRKVLYRDLAASERKLTRKRAALQRARDTGANTRSIGGQVVEEEKRHKIHLEGMGLNHGLNLPQVHALLAEGREKGW